MQIPSFLFWEFRSDYQILEFKGPNTRTRFSRAESASLFRI